MTFLLSNLSPRTFALVASATSFLVLYAAPVAEAGRRFM